MGPGDPRTPPLGGGSGHDHRPSHQGPHQARGACRARSGTRTGTGTAGRRIAGAAAAPTSTSPPPEAPPESPLPPLPNNCGDIDAEMLLIVGATYRRAVPAEGAGQPPADEPGAVPPARAATAPHPALPPKRLSVNDPPPRQRCGRSADRFLPILPVVGRLMGLPEGPGGSTRAWVRFCGVPRCASPWGPGRGIAVTGAGPSADSFGPSRRRVVVQTDSAGAAVRHGCGEVSVPRRCEGPRRRLWANENSRISCLSLRERTCFRGAKADEVSVIPASHNSNKNSGKIILRTWRVFITPDLRSPPSTAESGDPAEQRNRVQTDWAGTAVRSAFWKSGKKSGPNFGRNRIISKGSLARCSVTIRW